MAKKRSKVDINFATPSTSPELFEKTEAQPAAAAPKKSTPQERLLGRVTYDIGVELKTVLKDEALELGVPASMLAKYLLLYAWDGYVKGTIPAPPLTASDSPAYRNIIQFDE